MPSYKAQAEKKNDPRPIAFGGLNTYKPANVIDDSESTIAENISIDKRLGQIISWGPWAQRMYPGAISSFFQSGSLFFVQCGVDLYLNEVKVYTLTNPARLYYADVTDFNSTPYIFFANGYEYFKYNLNTESFSPVGVRGPTMAPVASNIGRTYTRGFWAGCYRITDDNGELRKLVGISFFNSRISVGSVASPNILAPSNNLWISDESTELGPTFNYKPSEVGGLLDTATLSIGVSSKLGAYPEGTYTTCKNPLFYLTLTEYPDWALVSSLELQVRSTQLMSAGDLVIGFSTATHNYLINQPARKDLDTLEYTDAIKGPVYESAPGVFSATNYDLIHTYNVPLLKVGATIGLSIPLNGLTLEQRQSIKTIIIFTKPGKWLVSGVALANNRRIYAPPDFTLVVDYAFFKVGVNVVGSLLGNDYFWIQTYVANNGIESIASGPSSMIRAYNEQIKVHVVQSNEAHVSNIRLYRLGGLATDYQKVIDLPNITADYMDNVGDVALTSFYEGDENMPGPVGIKRITSHMNTIWGVVGNTLVRARGGYPEYYGNGISQKMALGDISEVMSIGSVGSMLYAMKSDHKIFVITQLGDDVYQARELSIADSLAGPDMAIYENGLVFRGLGGLYSVVGADTKELALSVKDKFTPGAGFLFRSGNRIVCTNPMIIINVGLDIITEFNVSGVTYAGSISNRIYLGCEDGSIYSEDVLGSLFPFDAVYQTKEFDYGLPNIYKYARRFSFTIETPEVIVDKYMSPLISNSPFAPPLKDMGPGVIKVEFIYDGQVRYTKEFDSYGYHEFSLPPQLKGKKIQYRFTGNGRTKITIPAIVLGQTPTSPADRY